MSSPNALKYPGMPRHASNDASVLDTYIWSALVLLGVTSAIEVMVKLPPGGKFATSKSPGPDCVMLLHWGLLVSYYMYIPHKYNEYHHRYNKYGVTERNQDLHTFTLRNLILSLSFNAIAQSVENLNDVHVASKVYPDDDLIDTLPLPGIPVLELVPHAPIISYVAFPDVARPWKRECNRLP
jgi:hypothetical protein